jgi:hypothetical protein
VSEKNLVSITQSLRKRKKLSYSGKEREVAELKAQLQNGRQQTNLPSMNFLENMSTPLSRVVSRPPREKARERSGKRKDFRI